MKKQGAASSYAFVQFTDIRAVVSALRRRDSTHIGNNKVKLGFGKSMPTSCVWIDDIPEGMTEQSVLRNLKTYAGIFAFSKHLLMLVLKALLLCEYCSVVYHAIAA